MEKSGTRMMLPQPTLRQLVVEDAGGGGGKSPWFGWVGCRKVAPNFLLFASRFDCFDGRRKDDQLELSLH